MRSSVKLIRRNYLQNGAKNKITQVSDEKFQDICKITQERKKVKQPTNNGLGRGSGVINTSTQVVQGGRGQPTSRNVDMQNTSLVLSRTMIVFLLLQL